MKFAFPSIAACMAVCALMAVSAGAYAEVLFYDGFGYARVAVCGNAEGEDVMRPVFGEVLGIGPQKVFRTR
jgi:hypothetical protein